MIDLKAIDESWTLFLDRDGVINHEKELSYIFHYDEFIFYEGVKEALRILSSRFGRIFIVTNQRGVGKGLMTEKDLGAIHLNMMNDIDKAGGRVDASTTAIPCRMIIHTGNQTPEWPSRQKKISPGSIFKVRSW